MRLVRQPHRAQAEQARRRAGVGQLRHGEGAGAGAGGPGPGRARGAGRGRGLHRDAPGSPGSRRRGTRHRGRPHPRTARPAHRQRAAHGARDRARDGARPAVHLLAVDLADAGGAGRGVGCLAVPPRGVEEPAPRRDDHGHAGVDGRAGRVRLVGVGTAVRLGRRAGDGAPVHARDHPWRCGRADLPRGRVGCHDVPAGRAVLRGPVQAAGRGGAAGAAGAGRQGRRGAP